MRLLQVVLAAGAIAWLLLINGPWSRVPLRPQQFPLWNLAYSDGIDATLANVDEGFRATVARQLTGNAWQIRAERRLPALTDERQVLRLRVRSDRPRILLVTVRKGAPPWDGLGLSENVPVGSEWLNWEMSFEPTQSIPDAVLTIGIGDAEGTVEVEHAEVIPLPHVRNMPKAARTTQQPRLAGHWHARTAIPRRAPRGDRP